ncbi:MAG: YggS family pyridoxal phosphate-dependent enzyme [Candidatus Latescibacteria bacterium]|nr:YggS family pyridoxal phosphate-dependent enzyme [Candidatus Latescibacterota bacterium]
MIARNIKKVEADIADIAASCGRDPAEITIVAVSKTRTAADVDAALESGVIHIGENRVQEAEAKIPDVRGQAAWHMIGHLQSNKAKKAAAIFDWVQSTDSQKLAAHLSAEAMRLGKTLDVLVQVNISGEDTKSGVDPSGAEALVEYAANCDGLNVRGLMTIGSLDASEDTTRREFAEVRLLFDRLRDVFGGAMPFDTLSMGMSGDYRIAVEEGSTMLRIGTALFGGRESG